MQKSMVGWMKHVAVAAFVAAALAGATGASAATLVKMTFDAMSPQDPAPNTATLGVDDYIGGGIPGAFWRVGSGHFSEAVNSDLEIVASTGPQGGSAIHSQSNLRAGYKLDGNDGQITVGYSNPAHKRGWTYEAYVRFGLRPQSYYVTVTQDGWNKYPACQVKSASAGNVTLSNGAWLGSGGAWISAETPELPLLDGQWHHIASVFESTGSDQGSFRIYVDGVLRATNPNSTLGSGSYPLNFNGVGANAGQYQHNEVVNDLYIDAIALSDVALDGRGATRFVFFTVPEPASVALLALVALGGLRRRGRAAVR